MRRIRILCAAVLAVLGAASAYAEDNRPEDEVGKAVENTLKKGFTYVIRPVASLSDFNRAREAMAGTPVQGKMSGGLYHASDGTYEIYRKAPHVVVRGGRGGTGWLPYAQFTAPFRVEVNQAFVGQGGDFWRRGNVSKGRDALGEIIQIDHLVRRADLERLLKLADAFQGLKQQGAVKAGATTTVTYLGQLTPAAAFETLQGPFETLVERKVLAFANPAGEGRIRLQGGLLKSLHVRLTGTYLYYQEDDNVQKKGQATLEILGEVTKVGETKVEPPADVTRALDQMEKK
jgi:hypothetical protein